MGTWNTSIKGNDTTMDIYGEFMDRYGSGMEPTEVSREMLSNFSEYLADPDERNDALFGLALAQWEVGLLDASIFTEVKRIVETGEDLVRWRNLEASEADINKRKKALDKFLQQISVPRAKPKSRRRRKPDASETELVRVVAPDGRKELRIAEWYFDGKYDSTQGSLDWVNGGQGVLSYRKPNSKISAVWEGGGKLLITHEKDIEFWWKEEEFFFYGDAGTIEYVRAD